MKTDRFTINSRIDVTRLRSLYQADGRVRVSDFLSESGAEKLLLHIATRPDWVQVLNSGNKIYELSRAARCGMPGDARERLEAAVQQGFRDGFQFRYETIRVSDGISARAAASDLLNQFAIWLSSPPVIATFAAITGYDDIRFADAQATAFDTGDFLTSHNDQVDGKARRAALVFGLSRAWRTEWGGLLLFHNGDGSVEGLTPAFNALDIMTVPTPHSVSHVAPGVLARRYSVTGWLRAQEQPA